MSKLAKKIVKAVEKEIHSRKESVGPISTEVSKKRFVPR